MIDIHNHILPLVDDGSNSLELSRKLLMGAYNEGISDVCITPHFARVFDLHVYSDELEERFLEFKKQVKDIKVNLYLGNELFIDKEMDKLLLEKKVLSLNNSKYVLIEFPFDRYDDDFDEYLYNISLDYKIIIAHPERYDYVLKNHKFVDRWLHEGYYLQANQSSLFNFRQKHLIYKLIEDNQLSFIASDAHNASRPLSLKNSYEVVKKKFDKQVADILMNVNPMCVLNNTDLAFKKVSRRVVV